MTEIDKRIRQLVDYGVQSSLFTEEERVYTTNLLLDTLGLTAYEEPGETVPAALEEILGALCDYACAQGLCEDGITARDLFDTRLMNCLTPRPQQIIDRFWALYEKDPREATDYYYHLSRASNYIRTDRVRKDLRWKVPSPYGEIDISINLSKPEKDPKAIAAAKKQKASGYPKCLLCMENEGYAGHMGHPARNNHRIIPITVNGAPWGLQYSPYVYYNEHCIVLNRAHEPMKIERAAFQKLLDFVGQFPHYFLGSNADLPIVGGSILSHDHFQGGRYDFPMAKAQMFRRFAVKGFEDVEAGVINWPLSVIRIRSRSADRLVDLADHVLARWRGYTDERAMILAETDGERHNTITPIARKVGDTFELDLTLRNNLTTAERPMGLYHPREEYHHIKKENIGLIEVMGLAILPARLKTELQAVAACLLSGGDLRADERTAKHADWAEQIARERDLTAENVDEILRQEVGNVFVKVLEDAGVFKHTAEGEAAFGRFINTL